MRIHMIYIVIGLVLAFVLLFELAAHASIATEQTKITIDTPKQIPDKVLPAGTYTLELADDETPDIVRTFNADRTVVEATLNTVPAERPNRLSMISLRSLKQILERPTTW